MNTLPLNLIVDLQTAEGSNIVPKEPGFKGVILFRFKKKKICCLDFSLGLLTQICNCPSYKLTTNLTTPTLTVLALYHQ